MLRKIPASRTGDDGAETVPYSGPSADAAHGAAYPRKEATPSGDEWHGMTVGMGEIFVGACSATSLRSTWWLSRGPR